MFEYNMNLFTIDTRENILRPTKIICICHVLSEYLPNPAVTGVRIPSPTLNSKCQNFIRANGQTLSTRGRYFWDT